MSPNNLLMVISFRLAKGFISMATKGASIESGVIKIEVASDIVSHLSFSIYKNFARAIRELISNSYDANATEVRIGLDLNSKVPKVTIRDNGNGLDKADMEHRVFRLGNVTKFTDTVNELGRKRVGQFGIGFISAFPYCDRVVIVSKKKGVDYIVQVQVDTRDFFQGETFDITEKEITYNKFESDLPLSKGETIVTLEGIKSHIVKDLSKKKKLRPDTTIDRFEGFEKFRWTISQFAPIQFPKKRTDLANFFKNEGRTPLRVWLDNTELFRNVPDGADILEKGEAEFGSVQVKYAIMTPYLPVQPQEARGLQIRVCDVGIGFPRDFDVIKLRSRVLGKLNYICGEIHVVKGILPLMIDRDDLSFTQEMADMQEFFIDKLTNCNARLEELASADKTIRSELQKMPESRAIVADLQKARVLNFPESRIRLATRKRPKRKSELSTSRSFGEVMKRRGYNVKIEKDETSEALSPIEIRPKDKVVVIRESHPSFKERITLKGRTFEIRYNQEPTTNESLDSACKIKGSVMTFNRNHSVFDINLEDDEIKKLVAGLVIISSSNPNRTRLLRDLYSLLKEIF